MDSSGSASKAPAHVNFNRLAPLDHVRNLYAEASTMLPRDSVISAKADLARALRQEGPGHLSKGRSAREALDLAAASALAEKAGHGLSSAVADSSARTMAELDRAVIVRAKAYNLKKAAAEERARALDSLRGELEALQAEAETMQAVQSRTELLTKGHSHGLDPLTAPVSIYEAVKGLGPDGKELTAPDEDDEDDDSDGDSGSSGSEGSVRTGTFTEGGRSRAAARAAGVAASRTGLGTASTVGGGGGGGPGGSFGSPGKPASLILPLPSRVSKAGGSQAPSLTHNEEAQTALMKKLRKRIKRTRRSVARREFTKKQYEHMLHRLRHNAEVFERHMKGLEDAIKASKKELVDVKAYSRMLEQSRNAANVSLRKAQHELETGRTARAKELEAQREELSRAQKMETWRKQREEVRAEMQAELAGDLSHEQEVLLLQTLEDKKRAFAKLQHERRLREERAASLQEAFEKVKQITGATTLVEITQRFLTHASTRAALEAEKAECERRLHEAKDAYEAAQRDYSNMRASGGSGAGGAGGVALIADAGSRHRSSHAEEEDGELVQANNTAAWIAAAEEPQLQERLASSKYELKRLREDCTRLSELLVAVAQCAEGLAHALQPFAPILPSNTVPPPALLSSTSSSAGGIGSGSEEAFPTITTSRRDLTSGGGSGGSDTARSGSASSSGSGSGSGGGSGSSSEVQRQGVEALYRLRTAQAAVNSLVQLLARACTAYLRRSVESRGQMPPMPPQAVTLLTNLQLAKKGGPAPPTPAHAIGEAAGAVWGPTTFTLTIPAGDRILPLIPTPRKPYPQMRDSDLLACAEALLCLPTIDQLQRATVDKLNGAATSAGAALRGGGTVGTGAWRSMEMCDQLLPGLNAELLRLVAAVSVRMLAANVTVSNSGLPVLRTLTGPGAGAASAAAAASSSSSSASAVQWDVERKEADSPTAAAAAAAAAASSGSALDDGLSPRAAARAAAAHWRPDANTDPQLHGTNIRVAARPWVDPATGAIRTPAHSKRGKGGKGGSGSGNPLEDEEYLATLYAYEHKQGEAAEDADEGEGGASASERAESAVGVFASGIRTGILTVDSFMAMLKARRKEKEEKERLEKQAARRDKAGTLGSLGGSLDQLSSWGGASTGGGNSSTHAGGGGGPADADPGAAAAGDRRGITRQSDGSGHTRSRGEANGGDAADGDDDMVTAEGEEDEEEDGEDYEEEDAGGGDAEARAQRRRDKKKAGSGDGLSGSGSGSGSGSSGSGGAGGGTGDASDDMLDRTSIKRRALEAAGLSPVAPASGGNGKKGKGKGKGTPSAADKAGAGAGGGAGRRVGGTSTTKPTISSPLARAGGLGSPAPGGASSSSSSGSGSGGAQLGGGTPIKGKGGKGGAEIVTGSEPLPPPPRVTAGGYGYLTQKPRVL